jgi:hypothetical protein
MAEAGSELEKNLADSRPIIANSKLMLVRGTLLFEAAQKKLKR